MTRRAIVAAVVWAWAGAACGGGTNGGRPDAAGIDGGVVEADAAPGDVDADCTGGDPFVLTPDSPAEDEDPSALLADDGTLVVAYFARRGGNADLFVTSTRDRAAWSPPARVTTNAEEDFAPRMIQDDEGRFHLTWFRRAPAPTYYMHVRHASSADPSVWNEADEHQVTASSGIIADWVPTIAQAPDGRLLIVFASAWREPGLIHDLYAVWSDDGGATWTSPAPLDDLNDPAEHDHLPFVLRAGDALMIVWIRHDTTNETPWENATSDVMFSRSSDGVTWDAPIQVTGDDGDAAVDVFASLHRGHDGAVHIDWVTAAMSPQGNVVSLPVDGIATYPAERITLPLEGYSPQIVELSSCLSFGATVQGAIGVQDVYGRFFTR